MGRSKHNQVIDVRGARQHNLQNVDVQIPIGQLVVITGPSGSGKSSLAIDTVFAEGRRQYLETLSTYARRFLSDLPRPDVDAITGLPPTLCIDQHPSPSNPRSTVGTVTEIHDHLRLLMARAAETHCQKCGAAIRQMDVDTMTAAVAALPEGTKVIVLAPMSRAQPGSHADVIEKIRRLGLLRARVDSRLCDVDSLGKLHPAKKHTVEAVTDRIVVRPGGTDRLRESIEFALKLSDGICVASYQSKDMGNRWSDLEFHSRLTCLECGVECLPLEPRSFSFNNAEGACRDCDGIGTLEKFDLQRLIGDTSDTFAKGVLVWNDLPDDEQEARRQALLPFLKRHGLTVDDRFSELTAEQWKDLELGDGKTWLGLTTLLEQELASCLDVERQGILRSHKVVKPCSACDGARLGPHVASASVGDRTIVDICRDSIDDNLNFFETLTLDGDQAELARPIVQGILHRLKFLTQVGLGYLSLDRRSDSLSGGEFQRVRLATAMGSGLSQVCYVLDEPTLGLHASDTAQLLSTIFSLRDAGNTVLVVEHDEEIMRRADWIIDLGPGAGHRGGKVLAAGTLSSVCREPASVSGRFLAGHERLPSKQLFRVPDAAQQIELRGASEHNLQSIDVTFPLGLLICVTGVSGSGKSTVVHDTLAPAVRNHLDLAPELPGKLHSCDIKGVIDHLVFVDQHAIGRSPRSNTATYTGIMSELRKLFAETRDAKIRGFKRARFSFNAKSGWCPACRGYGVQRIEMTFLPDLFSTCTQCKGRRYDLSVLQVRYRGHSIADVLDLTIDEVLDFLSNVETIRRPLQALVDVGLSYLTLGQPAPTLSGGEAQRVKLATELARPAQVGSHTLYLLDEPTTGLHFRDVQRLIGVLEQLVEAGNSVILIEHHLNVIAACDWVVDLGPGGGKAGGLVVGTGNPRQIAEQDSPTGRALQRFIA